MPPPQLPPGQPDRHVPAPQDGREPGVGSSITLLVALDLELLRSALVILLGAEDDFAMVAAVPCDASVVEVVYRLRPCLVVIDVEQAGSRGVSTIRELRRLVPQTQVVALTVAQPPNLVRDLLAADVRAAVDKHAPAGRLLAAIRGAVRGEIVVDAHLTAAAQTVLPNPLTAREVEVLGLVGSLTVEQLAAIGKAHRLALSATGMVGHGVDGTAANLGVGVPPSRATSPQGCAWSRLDLSAPPPRPAR